MAALLQPDDSGGSSLVDAVARDLDITGLAASAVIKRIKAGETLYVEGDAAPYCYQIVSGFIKEYNTLEDGRRQVADFYSVGELFGVSELETQLHTAEAITDCVVRCYPRETYLQTVASSPLLSKLFVSTLMARLHRARERMIMLGRMSAIQRVAAFLERLAIEHGKDDNVEIMMSRQDIADHLGLTIETVCRALTELKKRGVIMMASARLFSTVDKTALRHIAQHGEPAH